MIHYRHIFLIVVVNFFIIYKDIKFVLLDRPQALIYWVKRDECVLLMANGGKELDDIVI
jgi:hypothetical protein